jgi:hypothetical protein
MTRPPRTQAHAPRRTWGGAAAADVAGDATRRVDVGLVILAAHGLRCSGVGLLARVRRAENARHILRSHPRGAPDL